ncbi:UNVERIFIED_CONTAM: cell wall-associated NlpC family hydrolase [Acetivibrio alkalicellulosi]
MKKIISTAMVVLIFFTVLTGYAHADYYSHNITLRHGMRHSEVITLQDDLRNLGFFNFHTSTGYFGDITRDAVMAYQRSRNLNVDGIVGTQTARQLKVEKVMWMANFFQDVKYVWGGTSPSGFDCSGYTHYVLFRNGIIIPRVSRDQYDAGTWVQRNQLRFGDLVFFTTIAPGPSHVGFYLGNNNFIHASSGAGRVIISSLNNPYYSQRYIGSKRVI